MIGVQNKYGVELTPIVRRRVREPVKKLIRGRRIDSGIKQVRRRVGEPVRKLIRGRRIDWGIKTSTA